MPTQGDTSLVLALNILLLSVAVVLAVHFGVLSIETLASLLPARRRPALPNLARPRCAVLVPAHDEELGIGRTLSAIRAQLQGDDRLIVVADNCRDDTSGVARSCGATVVERNDETRRGKGFALDFGIRFLEHDPPEVVVIIDADCRIQPRAIDNLVRETAVSGRPTQAIYLIDPPLQGGVRDQLSSFACLFKNSIRPLGLNRLGFPCLLTGTGMAFPWWIIRDASLASGNIVEDMQLGLELALEGHSPNLCPGAQVRGELPSRRQTAFHQRTRWEHGHMQTLLRQVPRLLGQAILQRRLDLASLALELSVPPLSILFLLWAAILVASVGLWFVNRSPLPVILLGAEGGFGLFTLFFAWIGFGMANLPLASLLAAPFYALGKVPIYVAFLVRPQRAWVRTERTQPLFPEEKSTK